MADHRSRTLICLLVIVIVQPIDSLDVLKCRTALGMQSGEILDSAITASSSFDPSSVGPTSARIRIEAQGGAWCPREQVSKDSREYLEIDLGSLHAILLVETQGRFGNGQGQEYVEQYKLEYQREDSGPWFKFRNRRNVEIFPGNSNTYIAELRDVDPPIIARRVRFVPYSAHPKSACMRVELYGCVWKDGVVAYSMPQGERRSVDIDLIDAIYDGDVIPPAPGSDVTVPRLSGGLGQLTDGEEGQPNFRLDPRGLGVKGYQWVGWRNDSFSSGFVEMLWKFDAVRNFSSVRIHCNNMFAKEVRVFKLARVYFSVGGRVFATPPIEHQYMRDSLMEYARVAVVPLQHSVGRYVKLQLEFDARWMMISEVQFDSEYVVQEIPVETEQEVINGVTNSTVGLPVVVHKGVMLTSPRGVATAPADVIGGRLTSRLNDESVGAIVGAVLTVSLLVCLLVLLVVLRRRRRRRRKYLGAGPINSCSRTVPGTVKCSANLPRSGCDSLGAATVCGNGKVAVVNGNVYDVTATSDVESDVTACCGGGTRRRLDGVGTTGTAIEFYHVPGGRLPDLPKTPDSSDTYTSRDYGISNAPTTSLIINVPQTQSILGFTSGSGAAATSGYRASGGGTLRRPPCPPPPRPPVGHDAQPTVPRSLRVDPVYNGLGTSLMSSPDAGTPSSNYLSSIHRLSMPRLGPPMTGTLPVISPSSNCLSSVSGLGTSRLGSGAAASSNSPVSGYLDGQNGGGGGWLREQTVNEFPRENLRFVEKIGDGLYGEVHLCEAFHISDYVRDSGAISLPRSRSSVVIVKTLRRNANEQARTEFDRDLRTSSRMCDINVVRLLGVCLADEPRCIILEYPRHGDLTQYLRHHAPPDGDVTSTSNRSSRKRRTGSGPVLSYGTLIYIGSQVASGMKHLESLQVVHKDLAARNCLVGDLFEVKIADLGSGRDLYAADYCRIDGVASAPLPVRWMSWEAALQNRYSMKSDVWSFGVILWEILTYAKSRPLTALTDAEVIANLDRMRCSASVAAYGPGVSGTDDAAVFPDRPGGCPRETYDLMRECWRRDADSRPTFKEVHMFLQRLNAGYSPFDGPRDLQHIPTTHVV